MSSVRKSNCHHCGYLCGVDVVVDDQENIESIMPDPGRYPYDPKLMNRCHRFAAVADYLDHPDRVNYPMKRTGKRGSGSWQPVSWDEAMDEITERLRKMKSAYGAESLSTAISAPHALYWPMHRFMNLWGSPNNIGIGTSCWNPRIWVNSLTYGWSIEDEIDLDSTRCVVLWGVNPAESDHSLFWKTVNDFTQKDGTLIVVDPRQTKTARLSQHWLDIKPGTDGALALGMLNIIVEENLYDEAFVKNWCTGFDTLAARVKDYPVEKVSRITGIGASVIAKVARIYARSKPAAVITGLGIDMSGANCTQTLRAIAILRAITGNLDTPGACFLNDFPDFVPEVELELSHLLAADQREKKLGQGLFELQRYRGYERLTRFTERHGKTLPARYLTSAHPHLAWQAMITGKPYPIRGLMTFASNPLLCQSDTHLIYKALKGLDLLVCLEHFVTPTAMLADFILPMAGSLEQPMVQTNGGTANIAYGGPAAIAPRHERRNGFDFWSALGRRCGQEEYWQWENLEGALDSMFSPCDMSWSKFCEIGLYAPERTYHKYMKQGFATPSGKVELASTILDELGHDPVPAYVKVSDEDKIYPLTLITGARKQPYYSSQYRQIERLRKRYIEPVAEISQATAGALGLDNGDWVWVETKQGRIRQKLSLADMRDDTVSVEYGWWYPEQSKTDPVLGGVWESNANVLTSADTAGCDPILGQWSTRTLCCKIYKVKRKSVSIRLKQAQESDRSALIDMLWESGMVHAEPIEDYLVAVEDDAVIGCIRLEESVELMMIRPVVVSSKHRKKGIGRLLIQRVLKTDKPTAVMSRGSVVAFYETLGFKKAQWPILPVRQQQECSLCLDKQSCRPQPMIRDANKKP